MSKPIIGIDLGTTYSTLAYLNRSGEPAVVVNGAGERLTPSVLYCPPMRHGRPSVGQIAVAMQQTEPMSVLREVKRHMQSRNLLTVGNRSFTPAEASSHILHKLLDDAKGECGVIDTAVITVPANFAEEARRATIEAGNLAGIDVHHIINEPTAAALYYSHAAKVSGMTLIFDLGGGTFDATIANIQGQTVQVITSEGDKHLGGVDFDRALLDLVQIDFLRQTGTSLLREEMSFIQFQQAAEGLKKTLSATDSHTLGVTNSEGRTANVTISRAAFEAAIARFIDKAMTCVDTALDSAKLLHKDIRQVLLVGGSTRIPLVRQKLTELFGKPPVSKGNVDEAVALGACVYAGLKADPKDLQPLQRSALGATSVGEVTNHYFGTLALNDQRVLANSIILKKDTPIPCENTESYRTVSDGQERVDCDITQSAYPETDADMVKIVHKAVMPLPPGRPAGQEIRVTYSYDENQLMHCKFLDVASGRVYEHQLKTVSGATTGSDLSQLVVE